MSFDGATWRRLNNESDAMNEILDAALRPHGEVIRTAVGEETVLLHTRTNTYFGLDPLGSLVFQRLSDGQRPRAIIEEIIENFDADPEQATSDLKKLLAELLQHGLIVNIAN